MKKALMMIRLRWQNVLVMLVILALPGLIRAETLHIAVASNFADTLRDIVGAYQKETGRQVLVSSGSTGKLYAQIKNGAPFDFFMSADALRPELLAEEGAGDAASLHTYAVGQLAFLSRRDDQGRCPAAPDSQSGRVAIANPAIAPYGLAAEQVLKGLSVWETLQTKLVRGENIAQAYQFFYSGNVNMAYVANAQVQQRPLPEDVCIAVVPAEHHEPIVQKAIVLKRASGKPAMAEFLRFLKTGVARSILERYGYLAASS